ncbi:MAG: histidine--tRNA ligase [Aminivibrio sp.]|jgi:histidyl-tRNA synthetase
MLEISAPKGVRDILPGEYWKWDYVLGVFGKTAVDFGYSGIHLPVFEHTELFSRGIGDGTDVVDKEMYTFNDKGGRSITLRPEATASMVRAYLENRMASLQQPVKLWCAGPMFRYERPQKGRFRQFWQVDFESLGSPSPLADVETITLALEAFRRLGLSNLEVVINSVGCPVCRPGYIEKLTGFFASRAEDLCGTCQDRLSKNPLRILDCKRESCRKISEEAPSGLESLCGECEAHFVSVRESLDNLGAAYHIDKKLVRGLDYYTKTAYEILSGALGAQNAICGGGRYDNLAEVIGGPSLPAVGFAAGMDRIVMVMEDQGCSFGEEPGLDVFATAFDGPPRASILILTDQLRREGISADMDFGERSMKAQMKTASARGARLVCILGENELAADTVAVKNMASGEQVEIPRDTAPAAIKRMIAELRGRETRPL